MVSAGDFRNGVTLEIDGQVVQIMEFQQDVYKRQGYSRDRRKRYEPLQHSKGWRISMQKSI